MKPTLIVLAFLLLSLEGCSLKWRAADSEDDAGKETSVGEVSGEGGSEREADAGKADAGKADAGEGTGGSGCVKDADCSPLKTIPSDCATGSCEANACVYRARDRDRDGSSSASCRSVDGKTPVVVGDDCDDETSAIHANAWDGPEGDDHASACDNIDNDCSGAVDDSVLSDGTACKCTPSDVVPCALTSTGLTVVFPALDEEGKPLGSCKMGTQTCFESGTWGACKGIVGPSDEICDHEDNDCDGIVDNTSNKARFRYDADGDGHGAKWSTEVIGCFPPAAAPAECLNMQGHCPSDGWTPSPIPLDDCDDAEASRYPGAQEVCNRRDDNCDKNGGVEELEDFDQDGFTSTTYAGCAGGLPQTDCFDRNAKVRPTQTQRFDVGYCFNSNAQVWCFARHDCAKNSLCVESIAQEFGPGSVDYDCDGVEEPFVPPPADRAKYDNACAAAKAPSCSTPDAPAYTLSGAKCGGHSEHFKCKNSNGTCAYSKEIMMTACY